jgi:hypothetical protein
VFAVRLTAQPFTHEYACLIVRGYKTAETRKTVHLKNMCGRYVVLYAKQLHRMESLPAKSPEFIDELKRHWPDASDVMINSPWPLACENSDGHAWALVQLGETVTKTCCGVPCMHDCELLAAAKTSLHTSGAHANTCVCPRIGRSSMQHVHWT